VTAEPLHQLAIRRFILVAVVLPCVVVAAGVVIQLFALPHLPATVAVHWSAAGEPNRFAPAWTQPIWTIVLGLGISLLFGLAALPGLRRGDRGPTYRAIGAIALGTAAFVTTALTWTLVMQVGDAATAVQPVWQALLGSFAAAVIGGVIAWFIQPAEDRIRSGTVSATPIALAPGEHVVWLRTTSMVPAAAIGIVLGIALLGWAAFSAWLAGAGDGVVAVLTLVALLLIVAAATMVSFHVRVDDGGLTVRSVAGIPRFRVPLGEIATAANVEVNAMGEFGGWGIRPGLDRRLGVILRSGPAIEVARKNGKRLVVTVEDAATGAGLLEALVARDAAARS
jgi:hypothetical protein